MSQIKGKWIEDSSISGAKLDATAKQSVLESKLVAARRGVLNFTTTAASSDTVTTEVEAAAAVDTPQTDLTTGEGIYVGTVANAGDFKKVLIRQTGTDNGVDDGSGEEVYGKLTEAAGVFTLSYFKGSDNTAFTFGVATAVDFYFAEVQDLHSLNEESLLAQAVSGVIDAGQAATLSGHLDGGSSKHDASEIDTEGAYSNITGADLETLLGSIDTAIGDRALSSTVTEIDANADDLITLSGVAENSTNLGTFTGTTISNSQTIKAALQELETAVETKADSSTVTEIDANVDDIITLSGVAENTTDLGTFTGTTITDNSTIKTALQELETEVETKADSSVVTEIDANVDDLITLSGVAEQSTDLGTFTGVTISDGSNVKGALQALETAHEETDANADDLITLSGVAENATDLGTFTGTTIPDNQTIKAALQSLETAVEGASTACEVFTLSAGDITNKYIDLSQVPSDADCVRLHPIGGPLQDIGVDFNIISDGLENKRLTWDSAEATVSVGLESVLAASDKLRVYYTI